MLSRWRKEVRDGQLRGAGPVKLKVRERREIQQLSALKREYALLWEEHELLKKAIRFCSARRPRSSPSSKRSRTGSA
jgi:transposase